MASLPLIAGFVRRNMLSTVAKLIIILDLGLDFSIILPAICGL